MTPTIKVSETTLEKLDSHREQDESYDELVQELINIYEQSAAFTREGYAE